jgi:hypothetical protein
MESTINKVYPWGRSFDEYRRMFALTEDDLRRRIIGCADGPASFNAGMNDLGRRVVSCDPLYQFDAARIRARIDAVFPEMVGRATRERDRFVWSDIRSPEMLGQVRREAMSRFLADYEAGRRSGRYVIAALPHLPFGDGSFDLGLCSHFLFLYSKELSASDHLLSVLEMCRVAAEVRIFPLVDMEGARSSRLDVVMEELLRRGFRVVVERVGYEFQKGGNELLRIMRGD